MRVVFKWTQEALIDVMLILAPFDLQVETRYWYNEVEYSLS